jgi:hypothetical protein
VGGGDTTAGVVVAEAAESLEAEAVEAMVEEAIKRVEEEETRASSDRRDERY